MKLMKRLMLLLALVACAAQAAEVTPRSANPKHEFRGAWMHIIGQKQYAQQSTAQNQAYLIDQLDKLQQAGCNAVIWQVRPQADAAYVSELEPWSRWITGEPGKAPDPLWDPLQFMIDESHRRGMELHAWINPYRVTSGKDDRPAPGHVYYEHPEWFLHYADGKIYFDPGLPESRDFIDRVVRDILQRYDVELLLSLSCRGRRLSRHHQLQPLWPGMGQGRLAAPQRRPAHRAAAQHHPANQALGAVWH